MAPQLSSDSVHLAAGDESVFRLAVESSPVGIVVCDAGGTILFSNRHVARVFGYDASELVGRTIEALVPAALGPVHQIAGTHFWARPEITDLGVGRDLPGRRKDGSEVAVEMGLTVANLDHDQLVVISVININDRAEFQDQVTRTVVEQAAFERMVTDLTARFVSLRPDQIHETIVDSLRQICEVLDLDRSTWWQFEGTAGDALATHSWTRPECRVVQSGLSATEQVPSVIARAKKGEIVTFATVDDIPDPIDREGLRRYRTKSGVAVPVMGDDELVGVLGFSAMRAERSWPPEIIERLRLVALVIGQALARKRNEEHLRAALSEVRELRDRLAIENVQLRREAKVLRIHRMVVAESAKTKQVLEQAESVAPTNATVLLLGETGTGKEVFAQAIHNASERHPRPMIIVNCGAIPSTLIESELFGRERGAFTGALARQVGRFELAQGSTIFLDEVGDVPLEAQVKLLRVLEDKVIERLGGGQTIKVDVRIIAATNRDLEKAVEDRTFREDLFYRLNVFPITVPPLRERVEDIPALVWAFIEEFSNAFGKPIDSISKDSLAALQRYAWPGNVRELRNVIERAVIVASGRQLAIESMPIGSKGRRRAVRLEDVESDHIKSVLESVGWRVRGPGGAADLLGVKPNTLDSRMAKLGIKRPAH